MAAAGPVKSVPPAVAGGRCHSVTMSIQDPPATAGGAGLAPTAAEDVIERHSLAREHFHMLRI